MPRILFNNRNESGYVSMVLPLAMMLAVVKKNFNYFRFKLFRIKLSFRSNLLKFVWECTLNFVTWVLGTCIFKKRRLTLVILALSNIAPLFFILFKILQFTVSSTACRSASKSVDDLGSHPNPMTLILLSFYFLIWKMQ